jgi:aminoglycoside phosphotransferase
VQTMPHGYTNRTTGDGQVVTKSYLGPGAALRCAREAEVLTGLAGRLPVPRVLGRQDGRLELEFIPGVPGQQLVDGGRAEEVLGACGLMLRRIHAVSPATAGITGHRDGAAVLVHGDYGPNNTLLNPAGREVIGVVDWEWAHAGDPVEDLAWCEWIIRMHHPGHVGSLNALFEAYGWRPPWAARHEVMIGRCQALLAMCERWHPAGDAVRLWQRRIQVTESWAA